MMTRTLRRLIGMTIGLQVTLIMVACGGVSGSGSAGNHNATITIAETVAPTTLDPQASSLVADWYAWELSYQCLLTTSATGKIQPQLATAYTVSGDGVTYDFKLRPKVQFHNGDTFTSADVVYTFQRLLKTGLPYFKTRFSTLKSVEPVGTGEVKFTLVKPDPSFLRNMAEPAVGGCAILDKNAASSNLALSMIGTGAYQMTNYVPHQEIDFKPFSKYWGPTPQNGGLKVLYVPDALTQRADLQSGKVDLFFPDTSVVQSLRSDSSVKLGQAVTSSIEILCINSAKRPFDDVRVRRAIALGVDRAAIARVAFNGAAQPTSYLPAALPFAPGLDATPYGSRNVAKAKDLLRNAGYPNGLEIRLMYIAGYSPQSSREVTLLKSQLAAIGVRITLDPLEQAAWDKNLNGPSYDLSWNFYSSFADPYQYLRPRPGRQGPVPADLQAKIDGLSSSTPSTYGPNLAAIAKDEANLAYPDVPLVAWKSYVAYKPSLRNVHLPSNLTRNFLQDVSAE